MNRIVLSYRMGVTPSKVYGDATKRRARHATREH